MVDSGDPPRGGDEHASTVTLDRLCRLLTARHSYAVWGRPEGERLHAHGVADPDAGWPVVHVPELAEFTAHFARILVRSDGYSFGIVCVVDRLSPEAPTLTLTPAALRELGTACLRYTGRMHGQKLGVSITVLAVGDERGAAELLGAYRSVPGRKRVGLVAWSLDPSTGAVWTNARLGGWLAGRGNMERTAAALRDGVVPESATPQVLGVGGGRPWLTYALLAVLASVFVLQLVAGTAKNLLSPSTPSLIALGGLFRSAVVDDGAWYRLVSAGFLHGGPIHLLLNGVAFGLVGVFLEPLIGRARMFAVFFLSLLGGSAASLAYNDPHVVSVGASGAIMGMLATALVLTYRLPYGAQRTTTQVHLAYWLVPALIPIFAHSSAGKIDFAAHIGGAVVGFVLGGVLLKSWPHTEPSPRLGGVARGVSVVGALVCVAALGQAWAEHGELQRQVDLGQQVAPDSEFSSLRALSPEGAWAQLEKLHTQYPRDPRNYFFMALLVVDEDGARAEDYLEKGLAETEVLAAFFGDGKLETGMRELLAALRLAREDYAGARAAVLPLCGSVPSTAIDRLDPAWFEAACR